MKAAALQKQALTALQPVRSVLVSGSLPDTIWLGLRFSQISLTAHLAPLDKPFAVFEPHKGKSLIYQANAQASAYGISSGMVLNAAYALCQNLKVVLREPSAEAAWLKHYAQSAARFTPSIVLSEPDVLLLEVKQSLHLFGGMQALHRQLSLAFDVPHIIACAPVADAAELMARNGIAKVVACNTRLQAALGDIPILSLAITDKLIFQLSRCGLHHLLDLWRLPRHDLARRFGPDLLTLLDQLSGQRIQPREIWIPALRFKAKYELDKETDNIEHLLQAAEHLLQQAQQFLQIRASVCEKITFYFTYPCYRGESQQRLKINVYAQQGGYLPEHFLPQLDEQLQRMQLAREVIKLVLKLDTIKPLKHNTGDLFKRRTQGKESWQSLLDILFARLGKNEVYHIDIKEDHRPEYAWSKSNHLRKQKLRQAAGVALKRPVWLLNEPLKCSGQGFKLISDAERLEAGWWEDQDCRREYYQGVDATGRRCWLYRDLQAADTQWYLHGLFA